MVAHEHVQTDTQTPRGVQRMVPVITWVLEREAGVSGRAQLGFPWLCGFPGCYSMEKPKEKKKEIPGSEYGAPGSSAP